MDALPMKEDNPHLEYQSIHSNAAHMCGHDGHMTCLLGGISKFLGNWDKIPEDKVLRLLFQPAEEAGIIGGGAKPMVEEGCLDGVDEVYGMHNWPSIPIGKIAIVAGPMMAEASHIRISFIGKGGHGSAPEKANNPLNPAIDFHVKFREMDKELHEQGKQFVCTLPYFHVGEADNVIAERSYLKGMLRSFDNAFTQEFKGRLQKILDEVCEKYKCQSEFVFVTSYPAVINAETETKHVIRVAEAVYGKESVIEEGLPVFASEDFSFFLQKRPGAFFFVGTWDQTQQSEPLMLHNLRYNFNDDAIEKVSDLWCKLAEDRLELNFDK